MSSEPLGEYIDEIVTRLQAESSPNLINGWPKGYWTMAVQGDNMIFSPRWCFRVDSRWQAQCSLKQACTHWVWLFVRVALFRESSRLFLTRSLPV